MRSIIGTAFAAVILAGCVAQNPNDGATNYNNVSPNPDVLQTEEQKLAAAENGTAAVAANPQNSSGISNTQNFAVTKERETIESDAARLAALKSTYQVVEPSAVPTRRGGINLAAYALKQTNPVGQRAYRRSNTGLSNCSRYRDDPDAAQRAFLAAGGPEKDSKRLDSDGDGFACGWNPDVYRHLLQTNG